jgi:hypothetical protein
VSIRITKNNVGDDTVKSHHMNRIARDRAIETSLDAAIELDEAIRKESSKAQSLIELSELLLGTSGNQVPSKKELLNSPQFASLYYRAASKGVNDHQNHDHLDRLLKFFAKIATIGLDKFDEDDLIFIRNFCLGLNTQLVNEAYSRISMPSTARSIQLGFESRNGL